MRWVPLLVLLCACDAELPATPPAAAAATTAIPDKLAPPQPPKPKPICTAPSLAHRDPIDARDEAALAKCERPSTGHGRLARLCGQDKETTAIDHARLARAVRPIDDATRTHLTTIAKRGAKLKRRPNVFGLVGDSMTVSGAFLRTAPTQIDPVLAKSLGGIVDVYANVEAVQVQGGWRDSFGAPRAAKVGARAPWALEGGAGSPLMQMVNTLSPAVAVVLFGGNDAAYSSYQTLDELSDQFAADLERIIDTLEAQGIIVVLNTLARHGSAPGFEDCASGRELTNWRITVQTNALSARVVEIACRRNLPLIDVRDALDTAVNRGLGPDQIHPSGYEKGPDILDKRGMRCGYNVRNYVTLLMLQRLRELVFVEDAAGNRSSKQ